MEDFIRQLYSISQGNNFSIKYYLKSTWEINNAVLKTERYIKAKKNLIFQHHSILCECMTSMNILEMWAKI